MRIQFARGVFVSASESVPLLRELVWIRFSQRFSFANIAAIRSNAVLRFSIDVA
jgi:hypothetical protein